MAAESPAVNPALTDAARTRNLPLEDALQLVHLYAERASPKYERAALRWLERYLAESEPRLRHFAEIAVESRGARERERRLGELACFD